ncbi:transcriptional regulator [Bordetella pertussis]|nr:transcriptional regulator [Bordetella pertussis]
MARIRELLESGEADAWSLEELARHACLSVAQAACLAGYTSAANFATAFRRAFGVTPGQLRARR